jgi:hypothetical protein
MKFNALYYLRNYITALPLYNSRLGALQAYSDGTRPFGLYHPHGLLSDCCLLDNPIGLSLNYPRSETWHSTETSMVPR